MLDETEEEIEWDDSLDEELDWDVDDDNPEK
jgi:hypothetical protein